LLRQNLGREAEVHDPYNPYKLLQNPWLKNFVILNVVKNLEKILHCELLLSKTEIYNKMSGRVSNPPYFFIGAAHGRRLACSARPIARPKMEDWTPALPSFSGF